MRLTRDHLSVIGAVTATGTLLVQVADQALRGPDVVRFLRHLLAHLPGTLPVIGDGAAIHAAQPVKDSLAAGAASRRRLERLPGYAPDLDPLGPGVWHHLTHVALANVCCTNAQHLRHELRQAVARLRHKPHVRSGAIRHAGYDL